MTYGRYQKYHPWLYEPRFPILWWIKKWAYIRFILREMTSLAVVFYAVVFLLYVNAVSDGPEAFAAFTAWLKSPLSISLHAVAFFFLIFHSITWFNLAPKAMVIHIGPKKVSGSVILVMNYLTWVVVTVGLFWLLTF